MALAASYPLISTCDGACVKKSCITVFCLLKQCFGDHPKNASTGACWNALLGMLQLAISWDPLIPQLPSQEEILEYAHPEKGFQCDGAAKDLLNKPLMQGRHQVLLAPSHKNTARQSFPWFRQ